MRLREQLPVFYSDPQIRHLPHVLEQMHRGQLLIPGFQRPFVLPKEMRITLFDSILRGIPVGTIMTWRARSVKVLAKDRFGPFLLPAAEERSLVREYLIDGEQWLATLYFALVGGITADLSSAGVDQEVEDFQFYYDLLERKFVARSDVRQIFGHHLPLKDLLTGAGLVRFQRDLAIRFSYPNAEELVELADELADAFRSYKFPEVFVVSEDLDLVLEAFIRVNSQRVNLSDSHMVNALTWGEGFDFIERLQQIRQGALAELGWDDVSDQAILRVCEIAAGVAIGEHSTRALSHVLRSNPKILDEVEENIYNAASFLRSECGVRAADVVPYSGQIILLAAAFRERPGPPADVRDRLRDWFWLTTYSGMLVSQKSGTQFLQLLKDVRSVASGGLLDMSESERPVRYPLPRFDFRSARSRGLALLLAEQGPLDSGEAETQIDMYDVLARYRIRALPQLITSAMVKGEFSNSPGARVLVRPNMISSFRKMLRPDRTPPPFEILQRHIISPAAYGAFQREDYAAFVGLREQDLNRMEEDRFSGVLARLYPTSAPGKSPET